MFWTRREKLLERALEQFAGRHVAAHVSRFGERAFDPYWEKLEMSLGFFDVASFGPTSQVNPDEAASLIYEHMSHVTHAIVEAEGVVDDYCGDAIFGYWGVEGALDHAHQSIQCASEILRRIQEWTAERTASGRLTLNIKAGIHTGLVSYGLYGTTERMKLTAMGNAVNVASALCNQCPAHSASCLVSGATLRKVNRVEEFRNIGELQVKGYEQPIDAYVLSGI